ncbi:cytochrome c [Seohaeicola saemankumensis]|nr:c-type cytochrome [Seohaeicola saemankumensis]MCA0873607.1 cytochrome c [Seohaeicola saemankumensis]
MKSAVTGLVLALIPVPSFAQEALGRQEYLNSCAGCHGAKGKGDGPLAELLTVRVSDLTVLAANNDGTFPMHDVLMFIDGRSSIRAHGSDMPIWGQRYVDEASAIVTRSEAEEYAKRRALALATYIEEIQQ